MSRFERSPLRMHGRAALFFSQLAGHRALGPLDKRSRPRLTLLTLIVLAHLLAIVWLITRPVTKTATQQGGTVLALSSFAPEKPPSQPPRPVIVRQLVKPLLSVPGPPPAAAVDPSPSPSAAVSGVAGQCQLAADMQAAIMRDPAAMAELAALPPHLRTAADVVMVWNGEWVELAGPAVAGDITVSAPSELKRTIIEVVRAASTECRGALIAGPLFIPIAEAGRTTVLVVGSGAWRWSELLDPAEACVASPLRRCPPGPPAADRSTI